MVLTRGRSDVRLPCQDGVCVEQSRDLHIRRLGGAGLVIESADRLAELFFALDRSSRGDHSYDAMTVRTAATRIERVDVDSINGPMRARSKPENWSDLIASQDLSWLAALDPAWDLMVDDTDWEESHIADAIVAALMGIIAPYRNVSVATKMLHLKRPALFPVLDRLVVESLGARISSTALPAIRADQALIVIEHLRGEMRRHREELVEIQNRLRAVGIDRTTTRIMDGLLWMTHPASELAPLAGVVARWSAEDGAGDG